MKIINPATEATIRDIEEDTTQTINEKFTALTSGQRVWAKHSVEERIAVIQKFYELLEEKFTLPEIHSLYETILAKSLDDRNFTKKLLATGIITKLNEKRQISGHRPPYLYKFNKEKYDEGLNSGVELVF